MDTWGGVVFDEVKTVEDGILAVIGAAREYCEMPTNEGATAIRHFGRELSRLVGREFRESGSTIHLTMELARLRAALGIK